MAARPCHHYTASDLATPLTVCSAMVVVFFSSYLLGLIEGRRRYFKIRSSRWTTQAPAKFINLPPSLHLISICYLFIIQNHTGITILCGATHAKNSLRRIHNVEGSHFLFPRSSWM